MARLARPARPIQTRPSQPKVATQHTEKGTVLEAFRAHTQQSYKQYFKYCTALVILLVVQVVLKQHWYSFK